MKKLIIGVTTAILAVFALSAMAAKPLSQIRLTAGPVPGLASPRCHAVNHTDQAIDAYFDLCSDSTMNNYDFGRCVDVGPESVSSPPTVAGAIMPGHYANTVAFAIKPGEGEPTQYSWICTLRYSGNPGDMTGTLCNGNGCIQMQ